MFVHPNKDGSCPRVVVDSLPLGRYTRHRGLGTPFRGMFPSGREMSVEIMDYCTDTKDTRHYGAEYFQPGILPTPDKERQMQEFCTLVVLFIFPLFLNLLLELREE